MIMKTAGNTDQSIDIFIQDSSSTTGAGLTGLAYNTSGLTCYYRRGTTGTATQLTLATQTVGGAHSDGGFVAVDGTNMPGVYRLDLSDAIIASGVNEVSIYLRGATNMAPCVARITLLSASADVNVVSMADNTVTAAALAADAVTEIQSGLATAASLSTVAGYLDTEIAAILEDTGTTIPAQISALNNLSAAQVNAEVDTALADIHLDHLLAATYDPASKPGAADALLNELVENDAGVARFTANALEQAPAGGGGGGDATEANQDIIIAHLEDIKGATFDGATDSLEAIRDRGDSAWTEVSAAEIRSAVGLASANLDTQLDALPTASENASQVRTELTTELGRIDAAVSTRLASASISLSGGAVTVGTLNDKTGMRLSATGVDDVLDEVVLGSYTLRQLLRGLAAASFGKLSGAATTTVTIRSADDTKDVVIATVDADGNRSAITLDLT